MGFESAVDRKIDSGKSGNKDKKATTKNIQVSLEMLLKHFEKDDNITFPIHLALLDNNEGNSRVIKTKEELLKLKNWYLVKNANVIRFSIVREEVYLEAFRRGKITVGINEYPECCNDGYLDLVESKQFYNLVMHPELAVEVKDE